jgi:type I restriction enzyme M protein
MGVVDAVISLPLNVFYGAGVPACLLILRKDRPADRRDQVLLVYAARHYRELSNQNELRPQDVMRILVHYHAYGDPAKVPVLVAQHSDRLLKQIAAREEDEVGRLQAEYEEHADRVAKLDAEIAVARAQHLAAPKLARLEKQRDKPTARLAERDERIAESRRRADDDRRDVRAVADELSSIYADPDELIRHARVVSRAEIEENEFNLNIPRYVDTFEPEPGVSVTEALAALRDAEKEVRQSEAQLAALLSSLGYFS